MIRGGALRQNQALPIAKNFGNNKAFWFLILFRFCLNLTPTILNGPQGVKSLRVTLSPRA